MPFFCTRLAQAVAVPQLSRNQRQGGLIELKMSAPALSAEFAGHSGRAAVLTATKRASGIWQSLHGTYLAGIRDKSM